MSVPLSTGIVADNLTPAQIKQFREFLISYSKVTEFCFVDCVNDFTSRNVKPTEDKCTLNCLEKFLKANQRMTHRFQEFQMIANENLAAAQAKLAS